MFNSFDILKKLADGGIVWIESARDLESARTRIHLFSRHKPGEYVIFDHIRQCVLDMPQVPFVRDSLVAKDFQLTAKKKAKKKEAPKKRASKRAGVNSTSAAEIEQVIANIVDEIERGTGQKH